MRSWLARLSFSFFILAAVLAWEGYQSIEGRRGDVPQSKIILEFVGAILLFILGGMGVRERHRPGDQ